MSTDRNVQRLYKTAFDQAAREMGTGWEHLGRRFQRALVAERLLIMLNQQDRELVSDDTVRTMMASLYDAHTDQFYGSES